MSFAERAKNGTVAKINRCGVRTILESLSDDEAEYLQAILADQTRTHTSITADINDEGFQISDVTVGRHRIDPQVCSCRLLVKS